MSLKNCNIAFFLFSLSAFAQVSLDAPAILPLAHPSPEVLRTVSTKSSLESLTSPEKIEFLTARQKALTDPAVQSTREVIRLALHQAILKADPSVETILANMNRQGLDTGASRSKNNVGGDFQHWLANFPLAAISSLSPSEKERLEHAYTKALLDPSLQEARKHAHAIFYSAMMNADPLIVPILNKAGIAKPSSMQVVSEKSPIESEEKIPESDISSWGEEMSPQQSKISMLMRPNTPALSSTWG